MKQTATLTSKGQITIPVSVRQSLGVSAGDLLEFELRNGRVEVRAGRSRPSSAGVLKSRLPKGWKAPSSEAMDAGIARELGRKTAR